MKILYIINSLSVGGAETIAANYAVELKKRGHEVTILQIKNEDTFLKDSVLQAGIPLYTTEGLSVENRGHQVSLLENESNTNSCTDEKGSSNKYYDSHNLTPIQRKIDKLLSIIRFCYYIRKINPDIIHVHTGLEKFRFLRWFPANKIFYTVHSEWSKCKEKGSNHKKMLFELINKGMNVIVLSSKAKSDVVEEFPNARVTVLPNGMNIDKIRDSAYNRDFLYREFGIPQNAFVVGHVGRFHPVKNHEKLIRIFDAICKKIYNTESNNTEDNQTDILRSKQDSSCENDIIIESQISQPTLILLLIGSGTESEQQRINSLVQTSQFRNNVIFAGVRQDATSIMAALDAIIIPSLSESFGLVPLEAQILGTRCVVSDVIPEEVFCNDNCIPMSLSASDDEWATVVLGKMTVNNSHKIDQFSLSSVIDRHLELYKNV